MDHAKFPKRAVIFDIDGVLIDSYDAHLQSWQQVAKRCDREISEKDFANTFGRTSREIIRQLWENATLSDLDVEAFDQQKEAVFRAIVSAHYPWMDGARELISALSAADFYLAVGSSGPRENVEVLLRQLGATHPIAVAVSGSDVLHGKPHPEVFQRAAEKLKIQAGNCAVIEDAAAGITAANAAGMLSIGLVSTGHERSEYAEADHVVSHLSELSADRIGRWIDASAGV